MKFTCPRCTERLQADDKRAGSSFDCPTCLHRFIIPTSVKHTPQAVNVKVALTGAKMSSLWLKKSRESFRRLATVATEPKKRFAYNIIALVLIVVPLVCIMFYAMRRKPELPAQVTKNYMESIANGDYTRAKRYVTESSLHLLADQESENQKRGMITYPSYKCNVNLTQTYDKQVVVLFNSLDSSADKGESLLLTNIDGEWKVDLQGEIDINAKDAKKRRDNEARSKCKEILLACKLYADDHDGDFPPDLETLTPTFLSKSVLVSPLMTDPSQPSYEYFGGKQSDPPKQVLLQSLFTTSQGRLIGYVDGTVNQNSDDD